MSEHFLKFKKRFTAFRIIKSAMVGVSTGLAFGGLWLMLIRLAIIGLSPITSLFVGIGSTSVAFVLMLLLSKRSDKSLAEELDMLFGLNARVQTMVEYIGESGEMIRMQREDTDIALSTIPLKSYKFERLWIYITALLFSAVILGRIFGSRSATGYSSRGKNSL